MCIHTLYTVFLCMYTSEIRSLQNKMHGRGAGAGPTGTAAAGPILEAKRMNLIKGWLQKFWISNNFSVKFTRSRAPAASPDQSWYASDATDGIYRLPYLLYISYELLYVHTLSAGSCSRLGQWWCFSVMFRPVPETHERGQVSSSAAWSILFCLNTMMVCIQVKFLCVFISGTRVCCMVIFLPYVRSGGCHSW